MGHSLTTDRLVLREFMRDDAESFHALESIPEVVRYQTYPPRSRAQAGEVVDEIVRAQAETPRRHVELAILCQGAFMGRVGAWIEEGAAALWYALMPTARGKGYATEAVRALMATLDVERFTIECDPRNVASWRLAERLGFVRESHVEVAFESKGEWVGSMVYVKAAGA